MGFLSAVSLSLVFSLVFLIQTEAVPGNRDNFTADGSTTLSHVSGNVTGESNNHTVIPQSANTTIQNHTNFNNESRTQHTLDKTALSGQENYGETYKNISQALQLEQGMKMKDLNVLLQKLGIHNCSRQTNHTVNQYQISLCFIRHIFYIIVF